jgi:hypothetical protein
VAWPHQKKKGKHHPNWGNKPPVYKNLQLHVKSVRVRFLQKESRIIRKPHSLRMPEFSTDNDPRPVPPIRPSVDDCCNGGCSPCVFDLYEEEMERYRKELADWEKRQEGNGKSAK